ncbi:glycosyltransferase [Tumidithrix elongata RA019]|uniref:Glycosyltransferase n=1 Tax=Tumidithrix elongata BACA0141 TaxID=2716417 RepID=A0AAW9PV76_9CYAN|nr:glycosyltransferase [Tumidithrix elongata RA019]
MKEITASKPHASKFDAPDIRSVFRPQTATLVMLGIILFCGLIAAAWFTKEGVVSKIFWQIQWLQRNPPMWLKVPMVTGEFLIAPTIALGLLAFIITQVSPKPKVWSRFAVVAILLILTIRYVIWRSLSTLNVGNALDGVFSMGLFILEMLTIFNGVLQLFLLVQTRDRRSEADEVTKAVLDGTFVPHVDVFVPTYNEPEFILRRTIVGCQAMEYPHKTIYLLDDTRRPEIKALAEELGCEYMSRPDNLHAKAGNLNHTIARTHGDLIVCFDADFVPTRNFLNRTVGFFQDEKVALVQTPQSYYSADPIARNLGLENILVPEQEVFYRQIQPVRDGTNSVVCAGTSFVMRRAALQSTGGEFVTSSLSEDYFTSVRLSGKGYRLVYLDEKLSAGAAPDDMGAQATQRLRWAQGTLQAFFIEENPLTIPGLSPMQRIAHLTGIMHWFTSLSRVGFLLIPLAYSFLNVIPVRATPEEVVFYFLPQYVVHLIVFSWLSDRSRSAFLSDIYDVVLCFPLAATVIQTMLNPFSKGFKVTPKGTQSDRVRFNWNLALPLAILFVATAISLWLNLGKCMMHMSNYTTSLAEVKGLDLGWFWSTYNLILLGVALLVMLDLPKPDAYEWFNLRRTVKIEVKDDTDRNHTSIPIRTQFWGVTSALSEVGATVLLTQSGLPAIPKGETLPIVMEIMEEGLKLQGQMTGTGFSEGFPMARISFEQVSLAQHRCLVELLFCRPGQWKRQYAPGELTSLWLLFKNLIKPKALFGSRTERNAIAVSQG